MKPACLVVLFACLLMPAAASRAEGPPSFARCEAGQVFADCTVAKCDSNYNCSCFVTTRRPTGVSIPPGCIPPQPLVGPPQMVQSRYSPVAATGLCGNPATTWAQCLGVTCMIQADGSALCPCTEAKGAPYVIVTDDPVYRGQCTDGKIYSSATFTGDVEQISKALDFPKPKVLWRH
ncbi:hypothetical protein [Inquilinus sp. CA228]|uniref:hypothetical protein n=1 Tax=Inquilinus sp. CA228 TaxID=3455609 RepID=UPI003F8D4436